MQPGADTKHSTAIVSMHMNHSMMKYPGCDAMLTALKTYMRMGAALEELAELSFVEWCMLVSIAKYPDRARIDHVRAVTNIKTYRILRPIDRLLDMGWICVRDKKCSRRGRLVYYDVAPDKRDKFFALLPFVEAAYQTATRN